MQNLYGIIILIVNYNAINHTFVINNLALIIEKSSLIMH